MCVKLTQEHVLTANHKRKFVNLQKYKSDKYRKGQLVFAALCPSTRRLNVPEKIIIGCL